MLANTTALDTMCGALPVSAEDATGLQARAREIKQRLAMPVCDRVNSVRQTSLNGNADVAGQSDVVTDSVICGYDANGSPVDELSRDLIEAARDAQGG